MSETPPEAPSIRPWTLWVPIIMIALAGVITYNWLVYLEKKSREEEAGRPPYIHRAEGDLILTERDGRTVRLSELRGKVILASWVFTRCPRGCAGVVGKLKKLAEEYAGRDDVHFICFALDPEDTPAMMSAFADQVGIPKTAPFWFVNGDAVKIESFMTRQLKFRPTQVMPEKDRLSPEDKYMHDLRVVLLDHLGNVRRMADLVNVDPEVAGYWDRQLRLDLEYLFKEKAKAERVKTTEVKQP